MIGPSAASSLDLATFEPKSSSRSPDRPPRAVARWSTRRPTVSGGRVHDDLRAREPLPLRITGELDATTQYLWALACSRANLWIEADAVD